MKEKNDKLEGLLHIQKMKTEEKQRARLEAELLELFDIRDDVLPLSKEDEELIMDEFVHVFPVTEWGRVDWSKVESKVSFEDEDIDSIKDVFIAQGLDLSQEVFLLFVYGDFPFVKTSLQRILVNLEEVRGSGSDQFIYCPTSKFVIEYFHDGDITIGWY